MTKSSLLAVLAVCNDKKRLPMLKNDFEIKIFKEIFGILGRSDDDLI